MFTRDSFQPTYDGPILATGETVRKAYSDAGANRSFVGNQRGYRPMNSGVSAGSRAMAYRANLIADTQAAAVPDADSAYLEALSRDAQARSAFDRAAAQERDSLRRLLLDTDATARTSDIQQRQDTYYQQLKRKERMTDRRIGQMQRGSGLFGSLAGLFS